jgi:UDP-glucose 4-epimerase
MRQEPLSPYAVSKLAGEQYCRSYWRIYGLETVCLRYFNVFGPRQDPGSQYSAVIPRFIRAILHDEPVTVHGDGTQSRDFTFVDNVVSANLLACVAPNAAGQVFNVACGERHTLQELIALIAEISGAQPRVRYAERRPGDVLHSQADLDRAKAVLGYTPLIGFADGLRKTIHWLAGQQRRD